MLLANALRNKSSLIPLITGHIGSDFISLHIICPEIFLFTMSVIFDNCISRRQNCFGRAIILLQHNGFGIRIILLKIHNIANISTTPTIDGLIRITYYAKIAIAPSQQSCQLILGPIGILILIHQNITEATLIPTADFLIFR